MSKICPSNLSTIDVDVQKDPEDDKEVHYECRICLQQKFPLIIPCKCDGTVKHVHEQCLKQWANQILKKKLKEQQDQGTNQIITSIQCQLCKQNIQLQIQWSDVKLTLQQAQQKSQDYFWPVLLINFFIILLCLGCLVFALVTLALVLAKSPVVDYQRFQTQPALSWSTLTLALVAGLIFLVKGSKDLYNMFYKKQFLIERVISKQVINEPMRKGTYIQTNHSNIQSLCDFKNQLGTPKSAHSHRFQSTNKSKHSTHQSNQPHQQQQHTNHDFIIPHKLSAKPNKLQKLPPLAKFLSVE